MAENDETSDERPALHDLRGVRYVGSSQRRVISKEDFAKIGIKVKNDLEWSADNEHLIAVGQLNAAAVDFLATQEDFELVTNG